MDHKKKIHSFLQQMSTILVYMSAIWLKGLRESSRQFGVPINSESLKQPFHSFCNVTHPHKNYESVKPGLETMGNHFQKTDNSWFSLKSNRRWNGITLISYGKLKERRKKISWSSTHPLFSKNIRSRVSNINRMLSKSFLKITPEVWRDYKLDLY